MNSVAILAGAAAVVLAASLATVPAASPAVHVVPSAATPTIASALAIDANGDSVEVLPGTYFEHDLSIDRRITLRGIGGATEIILDAQGLGRVLTVDAERVVLEGLTVTHGAAASGAGIDAAVAPDLTIRACIISENDAVGYAGGLKIGIGIGALPFSISDSILSDNSAGGYGGALWAFDVDLSITRCVFRNNTADRGAGAYLWQAIGDLTDCVFVANSASAHGGGLYYETSSVPVHGCTFYGNAAPFGGAISGFGGVIERTIITATLTQPGQPAVDCDWWMPTLRCCDLFGNHGGDSICGTDGGGNFSLDPLFCDAVGGDFHLNENSPCLPGNHPTGFDCGDVIGALGVGCGAGTSVNEMVELAPWSRVKAHYRH